MSERHTPVLVAGGSLVGLSASVLLARYGVPHVVVEGHSGTAIHPRAASFHQRTMEVYRSVGLQSNVEEAAAGEFKQNGAIVAVESLAGKELAYFYRSYNEGVGDLSPTDRLFITQVGLEPILRRRAAELGAEHLFGVELVSSQQRDDHVVSVIRPSGGEPEQVITSDYLVAADGAHSSVRERLGIPMTGRGTFADCITIYFRSDVNELMGERNLSVVYVNHPELLGFFRFSFTGDSGFLAVFATFDADGNRDTNVAEHVTTERCVELVRKALGAEPGHRIDIESVQRWQASAATAQSMSKGRVFLVGDAAHVMPPTGGFGGNTGVADAHNLAWKLAFTTQALAGPGLLDTYDAERRPIAALTVEQAYTRYVSRVDPSLPSDDLMPPLDDAAIELGAIYRSAAVRPDQPSENELDDPHSRSWTVGARVPHLTLTRNGSQISTLDVADSGFALLVTDEQARWEQAATDVQRALGINVAVQAIQSAELARGEDGGAALVRPDGIIAWKAGRPAEQAVSQLPGVIRSVLDVH